MSKLFKPFGKISGSNMSEMERIEVIHSELPTGDEDVIMDDDSDESDGEYLEYEIVEKPEENEEEKEKKGEDDDSSSSSEEEEEESDEDEEEEEEKGPIMAPRAFIRRNSIKHLSTQLHFRISEFLTIKDLTKSYFLISKSFSKLKLISYVSTKKFLPSEYEDMIHPKTGVGKMLLKKILLFKEIDLNFVLPWPSQEMENIPLPKKYQKKEEEEKNEEEKEGEGDDSNNINNTSPKILSLFTYACLKGYPNCVSYMIKDLSANPTIGLDSSLFFAISSGKLEIVKKLLPVEDWSSPSLIFDALTWAITIGEVKCLRVLGTDSRSGLDKSFGEGVDIQKKVLLLAVQNGRFEVFKRVLDMVLKLSGDFLFRDDERFRSNCMIEVVNVSSDSTKEKESLKMIEYLCGESDLITDWGANENLCFRMAVTYGRKDLVKFFLKFSEVYHVDPSAHNNEALLFSAEHGMSEIVALLLKDRRVDPFQTKNAPLKIAKKRGHEKVIKLLEKEMKKRITLANKK